MSERRLEFASALLPVVLAVLAFLPALEIGFFRDDYGWVEDAMRGSRDLAWLLEPAKTDFRPIPKLSVLLNLSISGIDPRGYALVNVLLHAVNVTLLGALARQLTGDRVAFIAATLFAVGAGNYGETVYWMVGRTGLLADLWTLCVLIAYDRRLTGGSRSAGLWAFAAFGLGLLSKETVVIVPLVLVVLEWLRRSAPNAAARRLWPYFALSACYGAFEFFILRSGSPVVGHDFALGPHMVTNFGEYFARMILPLTPSSMLLRVPAPVAPALGVVLTVLSVLAPLAVLLVALHRGVPRAARFGAWWAMIAILPVVALTFRTSTRYLYSPSEGLALAVAVLALFAVDRASRPRAARSAGIAALTVVVLVQIGVLAIAMDRRQRLQHAERGGLQPALEEAARQHGVAPPGR